MKINKLMLGGVKRFSIFSNSKYCFSFIKEVQ